MRRRVAQLASLDLNLVLVLRELLRERNVTPAAERLRSNLPEGTSRWAAGEIVVLAGIGLRCGPGMGLTSAFIFALDGAGLDGTCAVVTDGQMSGLVNTGIVVGEAPRAFTPPGPCGENGWLGVYERTVGPARGPAGRR